MPVALSLAGLLRRKIGKILLDKMKFPVEFEHAVSKTRDFENVFGNSPKVGSNLQPSINFLRHLPLAQYPDHFSVDFVRDLNSLSYFANL